MVSIRRLAAVDMALHGPRFIISEFAIGVLVPAVLGFFSIRAALAGAAAFNWTMATALWLIGAAANYIPLLVYAILIVRGGTLEREGRADMAEIKRYSLQQFIILLPFLVAVLALLQELSRRKQR
jgi:hypothetical protein